MQKNRDIRFYFGIFISKLVNRILFMADKIPWNNFYLYYNEQNGEVCMRKRLTDLIQTKIQGTMKEPLSLRKQLSRMITLCCLIAVCIQAAVMVAMIINQYVTQERENTLYILESVNVKTDNMFQYVEEMALMIQHDVGLRNFFEGEIYVESNVAEQLKSTTNLFSERNRMVAFEPFVEKIYLFNDKDRSISNLYYPMTISEVNESQKTYTALYEIYKKINQPFYFQTDGKYLNLCMKLYDVQMKTLGTCIFALNKARIEENYANLEKMGYYSWSIQQGETILLGKETISSKNHFYLLEDNLRTGFGIEIKAAVSEGVIYRSLGTTIVTILFISVVMIVLLSLFGHVMAVYYVRPLETVAEKIKLVGKGNFDTKLDEYGVEELRNISSTFNEMTDYIERLVKEVYETQLIAQQSQIQYLQSQMDPHFLFNVLSMIEMRAAMNQDKEVQEMLYKLSNIYQGKIFRKNEHFIPLEDEMEIVDFYLSLQNSRFGEKIEYSIFYEEGKEKYKKLLVPRLSIEPIVENAVCHGLEPKEGKGHIWVDISQKDGILKIHIKDNGVGFEPKKLVEKSEDRNHSHVGLWNTNKMIHNLCGKEYGLEIESIIGEGTVINVLLPVRIGENHVESNDC